jgi:NhaC family Na+:H+ antiporter
MAHLEDQGRGSSARKPSLADALTPVVALIGLLAASYYLFGDLASQGPNQIALLFCGLIAAGIAYKNGMPWSGLRQATVDGVSSGLTAVFILLAVGALIGTWAMSGTIIAMVYDGLKIRSPNYFYASSAVICAVVALSIGSSWTVAGTIGIGLMGIATNMGLSPEITAGAVISGAYFGDKASPLSDTVNLASASAGAELFEHIRESLWTSVPSLVLAVLLFVLLGSPSDFDAAATLAGIEQRYDITLWAFVPLLFVFALAVMRLPAFVTIFCGALLGGVIAVIFNPGAVISFAADPTLAAPLAALKGIWKALASGYVANTGATDIDSLLSRGGMESMLGTVWLIMTALAFGAVVEHAGLLARLVNPILDRARSVGGLVASVVASCIGANIVTSDQYIAIVLPGRMFRAEFERRGLAPVVLSRAVGDSATVTSPLIPWNSCGAYMAATLGVPVLSFAGFAFFCLINPLMTVLIALLGLRMLRTAAPAASSPFGTVDTGNKERVAPLE